MSDTQKTTVEKKSISKLPVWQTVTLIITLIASLGAAAVNMIAASNNSDHAVLNVKVSRVEKVQEEQTTDIVNLKILMERVVTNQENLTKILESKNR